MKRLACLLATVLSGCGTEGPAAPGEPPSDSATAPAPSSSTIAARLVVVDLEGHPLPNMIPIATRGSNACDPPVATGAPTDGAGRGAVALPRGARLFARAWDPELRWFANNFYEIFEGVGDTTQEMRVIMARGASLDGVVLAPDGGPMPIGAEVRLVLAHPVHGPWWPDRAATGENGAVHFPSLPAGKYPAVFEVVGVGRVETPPIELPPGGNASIGSVTLIP